MGQHKGPTPATQPPLAPTVVRSWVRLRSHRRGQGWGNGAVGALCWPVSEL
jgi:hypothetical protein